jgi:hypothetical protein
MWLSDEAPSDYWRGSFAADRGEVQAEKSTADLRAAAEAMAAVDGCAQKRRLDRASIDLLMEAWQVAPQQSRALVRKLTASLQNPSAYLMTAAQRILADCHWGDARAEGARFRGELRPSGELTDAERQEYWDYDCQRKRFWLRREWVVWIRSLPAQGFGRYTKTEWQDWFELDDAEELCVRCGLLVCTEQCWAGDHIEQCWPAPAVGAQAAYERGRAIVSFDGADFSVDGHLYLSFAAGATLLLKPTIHDEDGWAFGAVDADDNRLREWGWLPRSFFEAYTREASSRLHSLRFLSEGHGGG